MSYMQLFKMLHLVISLILYFSILNLVSARIHYTKVGLSSLCDSTKCHAYTIVFCKTSYILFFSKEKSVLILFE